MERPLRVVAPLVPRPKAVGYALHPENRTLQPVQRRFLVTYQSSRCIFCEECVVDQALVRFSGKMFSPQRRRDAEGSLFLRVSASLR